MVAYRDEANKDPTSAVEADESLMACRVADACDHAELTAKPEIGRSDSPRASSVNAFELRRITTDNLSRAADVAA